MNLSELKTERDLKQIVIEELGYRAATGGLELTLPAETEEKLLEKKIVAGHDGFEVILARIKLDSNDAIWKKDASLRAIERDFINAVPKHERDAKLFVFCAEDGEFWHFVNARSSGSRLELRRFSITPINRKRLRTTQDRPPPAPPCFWGPPPTKKKKREKKKKWFFFWGGGGPPQKTGGGRSWVVRR